MCHSSPHMLILKERERGGGKRRRAEVCGLLFSSVRRFQTVSFCLSPQQFRARSFSEASTNNVFRVTDLFAELCMCVACLHIWPCLIYIPSHLMECAKQWQLQPCAVTHPGKHRKFVPMSFMLWRKRKPCDSCLTFNHCDFLLSVWRRARAARKTICWSGWLS